MFQSGRRVLTGRSLWVLVGPDCLRENMTSPYTQGKGKGKFHSFAGLLSHSELIAYLQVGKYSIEVCLSDRTPGCVARILGRVLPQPLRNKPLEITP